MELKGIAARHARAGRKLAGLSVNELSKRAKIEPADLIALEDGALCPFAVHWAIHKTLMDEGIRFLFAELEGRLVVRVASGGVPDFVAIGAGLGLLKWSTRKLYRRAKISGPRFQMALNGYDPRRETARRCRDALFRHGCTFLKGPADLWAGLELRPQFWNRTAIVFGPHEWKRWE